MGPLEVCQIDAYFTRLMDRPPLCIDDDASHPMIAHDAENRYHYREFTRALLMDCPRLARLLWRRFPQTRVSIRNVVFDNGLPRTIRTPAWLGSRVFDDTRAWHRTHSRTRQGQTKDAKHNMLVYMANRRCLRPWTPRTHRDYPESFRRGVRTLLLVLGAKTPNAHAHPAFRTIRCTVADHFHAATMAERGDTPTARLLIAGMC